MPRLKAALILSLATMFTPAFAQGTGPAAPGNARPGTINYVEGNAALDGRAVTPSMTGYAAINPGQTLSTADGRAEILLTPGVFLRVGHNATVKMISPDLTRTEVEIDRGRADLEVDALYPQNDLLIDQGTAQTKMLKTGLYEFDATARDLKVFEGKAAVSPAQNANKWIDVKGGHELALTAEATKPHGFDKDHTEAGDDLYNWSSLRASYLGQANASLLSQEYAGAPGLYPGWAWDPYAFDYTWLPADGFLYSPFGFGFYSPAFFYGGGFGFYGGFRGGFGGFHGGYGGGFGGRGFGGGGRGRR
jgi:hypothetical protein